ncbi:alpha-(1,3)-fucosyltransferase 9-like [Spodoptera litura]|uniref:Fucosyltransferase n=1 Tax=Spodoptera litura TaxID=69820 RepID=A0A9J7ENE4_SPOLT|nr:alpha-(1,3)-fucosyltransferase 9-like [Spodoptera litura]
MFRRKITYKTVILFIFGVSVIVPLAYHFVGYTEAERLMYHVHDSNGLNLFALRSSWPTSVLGGILFHGDPIPNPNAGKQYVVLVYKYWDQLKERQMFNFGKKGNEADILDGCSVKNCIFSGDDALMDTADAVLVHLQHGLVPKVKNRNPKQRWIFWSDQSPRHTFTMARHATDRTSLYGVFNWSMTYRSDSDIPVPYGRTVLLPKPVLSEYNTMAELTTLIPNWDRKRANKTAAVLMLNCGIKARNDYVKELRKYINVDVYGRCSDKNELRTSCPGNFHSDCDPIAEYLFYLVLENTSCYQYLTEKVFHHAYSKGAIPVIFGPSRGDVESLLPPNSYIFADADTAIQNLAKDIKAVASNVDLLLSMHTWRNHFEVINEHGYFGTKSYHLCRVCEALNYNSEEEKVYDSELLDVFLDPSKSCYG